jgi:hypothetical protein
MIKPLSELPLSLKYLECQHILTTLETTLSAEFAFFQNIDNMMRAAYLSIIIESFSYFFYFIILFLSNQRHGVIRKEAILVFLFPL